MIQCRIRYLRNEKLFFSCFSFAAIKNAIRVIRVDKRLHLCEILSSKKGDAGKIFQSKSFRTYANPGPCAHVKQTSRNINACSRLHVELNRNKS